MTEIKALEKLRELTKVRMDGWLKIDTQKVADEIEAEIAERFMELPVDADGVPIHLGDLLVRGDDDRHFCQGISKPSLDVMDEQCNWWRSECFHHVNVKHRTLEDVLHDFWEEWESNPIDADWGVRLKRLRESEAKYADEIRDLMGAQE